MDKINHWSLNQSGVVYDSEEVSVLGLVGKVTNKTNEVVDKVNSLEEKNNKKVSHDEMKTKYKIDDKADFTGSWFGLKRPTESSVGLQATVNKIVDEDIPSLQNNLDNEKNINASKFVQIDTEIQTERNRIDLLTKIESGQTEGNTELLDLRNGADGVSYTTAGVSVREQFKDTLTKYKGVSYQDLNEDMREIVGSSKTPYIVTYKDGYFMNESLQETSMSGARYGELTNLKEGEFICFNGKLHGSVVYAFLFVDSANKLVSKQLKGSNEGTEYNTCVRVPKGATKCYINNYGTNIVFSKYEVSTMNMERLKDFKKIGIYEEEQIITLSESNTELLLGQTYTSTGSFFTNETYSTIYYPVGKYNSFILNPIGANGGAFTTFDKKWISSFSTEGAAASIKKEVPQAAYYIAITVPNANKYKAIKGYIKRTTYSLDNLKLNKFNMTEVENYLKGLTSNHWVNKKIGVIGTSVSFGANSSKSYAMEIQNKLGCTVKNFSVPGLALHTDTNGNKLQYGSFVLSKAEYQTQGLTLPSTPIDYTVGGSYNDYYRSYENVFTQDNADIDLWVFAVSPNNTRFMLDDWNLFNKETWSYTNSTSFESHRTTFIGSILFLMDKMYTLNPDARMVFVLDSEFSYTEGKSNLLAIKEQWNIPVLDLWGRINTSPKSLEKLKSKEGTDFHPSTFAHEIMGNMLANELLLIN